MIKFDDRVTWAVLITILVETVAGLLWAGGAAARLSAVETQVVGQGALGERLARLETSLAEARASLARVEARLDRDDP